MEESANPISAIASAIGRGFEIITGAQAIKEEQLSKLPQFAQFSSLMQSPEDRTTPILVGVLGLVVLALLVAVVYISVKK